MSFTRDVLTVCAVLIGAFFFLAGTVGLLRFPDSLTRLHALAKADSLGLGLIAMGLMIHAESIAAALKVLAVWLLTLLASATVAQLIAQTPPPSGPPV